MLTHGSILVSLLWLVEQRPTPPPPAKRQRGRQETYADTLFVEALIVMIIRRLSTAYALRHFLAQDDPVVQRIRPLLTEQGHFPTRRLSTGRPCALTGVSGTRHLGWPGQCRMPRWTPKPLGARPGLMAGGTAGSGIWQSSSAACGFPWLRSALWPVTPTMSSPRSCWSTGRWGAVCSRGHA
jgi:hypothetical protein